MVTTLQHMRRITSNANLSDSKWNTTIHRSQHRARLNVSLFLLVHRSLSRQDQRDINTINISLLHLHSLTNKPSSYFHFCHNIVASTINRCKKYCSQVFWQNGHVQGCVHFQFQLKCFVLRCTKETFDVQKTFPVNLSRHFFPLKGSWKLTKRQIIAKLSQHTVSYMTEINSNIWFSLTITSST